MSQKNYCDRCESEIGCTRGNDYIASQKQVEQFKVTVVVYPLHSNNPADLCGQCVKDLATIAFGKG